MSQRLFIVEGLPCSGKSTAAEFVARNLKETGKTVICVDEGSGDHPADYEFHAFVSKHDFASFDRQLQELISQHSVPLDGGYVVSLSAFSGEHFHRLLSYKIYDFLPWDIEKPLMLGKWKSFADNADKNAVYVFNCVFLQNPMCETMMIFDFPEEKSYEYICQILTTIHHFDPVVIYLKNDDIAERISETSAERDGWLESVIDYHVNSAYGKRTNAHGFDGYVACLEERQRRELAILNRLPVRKIVIDNAHRNWTSAHESIRGYINALVSI